MTDYDFPDPMVCDLCGKRILQSQGHGFHFKRVQRDDGLYIQVRRGRHLECMMKQLEEAKRVTTEK